jgi:predicted small metal-binding protein
VSAPGDKPLRCECGYEVRATDEPARVDEVRRHASEAHGIDLSADVALDVVRRGAGESSTPGWAKVGQRTS